MSPLSTALPPPVVEVTDSWFFPATPAGSAKGFALNLGDTHMRGGLIQPQDPFGVYGSSAGTGSTMQLNNTPGRQASARVTTTVAILGGGMSPPMIHMSYGPAADWNPGARQGPASVVSVYNVSWANSDALDNWPIDSTGFCFIPNVGVMTDSLRTASAPTTGFGIFFNTDGAGGAQVDYLCWNLAVVVERVTLGAGIVTDITDWNTARFQLISAANGREATMSLEINDTPFVTGRQFGTTGTQIPPPVTQSATALHYVFANVANSGGGAFYNFFASGYDGRFNPAGEELQGFG